MAYCSRCSKTVVGAPCSSSSQAAACSKRYSLTSRGNNSDNDFVGSAGSVADIFTSATDSDSGGYDGGCDSSDSGGCGGD